MDNITDPTDSAAIQRLAARMVQDNERKTRELQRLHEYVQAQQGLLSQLLHDIGGKVDV